MKVKPVAVVNCVRKGEDPVLVSTAAGAAAGEEAGEELPESGSSPGWSPLVGVALRAGGGEFGDEILSALWRHGNGSLASVSSVCGVYPEVTQSNARQKPRAVYRYSGDHTQATIAWVGTADG